MFAAVVPADNVLVKSAFPIKVSMLDCMFTLVQIYMYEKELSNYKLDRTYKPTLTLHVVYLICACCRLEVDNLMQVHSRLGIRISAYPLQGILAAGKVKPFASLHKSEE